MAKENSRELKMQIIFKQHPNVKEFHFTSDDQAFFNSSDAKNHAITLDDKEVETVKRSDVLKKVQITESKVESAGGDDERSTLMAKLESLGGKAAKNIGLEKLKEKIAELEAAKESEPKQIDVTVTQEALDLNPELVNEGVKVGDVIQVPEGE